MSRIRTALVAVPLAAAALLLGAGAASADNGAFAGGGSTSSTTTSSVTDTGSGNLSGWVDGNANWSQQTANGSGASNQNNTLGVKGNSGQLFSNQSNSNVRIVFGG
ncbi:hypothetical protein [Streptacidiphilus jiangxiensis]|uniref:Curlin associated repeat-containing protein n=1 Tax=Streptacidiphilus jiangxiensis TaxID=235985 RepID=A0A1H7J1X5_STRJI|nr:hypothetical protein [Streptacidiphilus jiangxiensis]SEK68212.1 hypothetical protein SAMN05414137_10397 [Streptacidiphilus jiangxiensis]